MFHGAAPQDMQGKSAMDYAQEKEHAQVCCQQSLTSTTSVTLHITDLLAGLPPPCQS